MLRYAVVGAGGIGSGFAGLLDTAGADVVAVGRQAHCDAINAGGLQMVDSDGTTTIARPRAVSDVDEVDWASIDSVLVAVKSYDTEEVARQLAGIRSALPPVICAQNGVRNEEIMASFGLTPIAGAVRFKARVVSSGRVLMPGWRKISLGQWGPVDTSYLEGLVSDFTSAGVTATRSEDIASEKWSKLIANCANVIYAITNTPLSHLQSDPDLVACVNTTWGEARRVLDASGVAYDPLPDLDVPERGPVPDESPTEGYFGSTWDDFHNKKGRSEVPWFNGEVLRAGTHIGLPTPVNRFLFDAAMEMQSRSGSSKPFATAELAQRLGELSEGSGS